MRIGCPTEIKNQEYRVGLTPAGVREIVRHDHTVLIQSGAGSGVGFSDDAYRSAGASIVSGPEHVFSDCDMVVKVKEPQHAEIAMLRRGQLLFTYLHLAPDPKQADDLLASKCTAVAYETVADSSRRLPLLAPMSEVAGRMSAQVGAHCLERTQQGAGILIGGVPGVPPARVVVLGGGVSGTNAARVAAGMGADVVVFDRSIERLRELDEHFGSLFDTAYAIHAAIEEAVTNADLVIGAVLVPGAAAPRLVTHEMVRKMRQGSVLVDIAIDQGGCFETSHATTHEAPTFVVDGVVHYCVANMPGAVARTSTFALTNATLPYILALASGWKDAMKADAGLLAGLNVHEGQITHVAVAEALHRDYLQPESIIG